MAANGNTMRLCNTQSKHFFNCRLGICDQLFHELVVFFRTVFTYLMTQTYMDIYVYMSIYICGINLRTLYMKNIYVYMSINICGINPKGH